MDTELHEKYQDRVFELTGDRWCPYPSEGFMKAILHADKDSAVEMIKYRRTLSFPVFLAGEPQIKEINKVLEEPR